MKPLSTLLLLLLTVQVGQALPLLETDPAPEKIVFGSCHNQNFSASPIWKTIKSENPDLVILLGDNVYIDSHKEDIHRKAYQKLNDNLSFKSLLDTTPLVAIWDDHDFGRNDDGRADHPTKEMAQKIFLETFLIQKERAPHSREGIYDSYTLGTQKNGVQIILLDTRTFRSPLNKNPQGKQTDKDGNLYGRYLPHEDSSQTLLGSAQWEWLKEELKKPAKIRILASSIQVVSDKHNYEGWGLFPQERKLLIEALTSSSGTAFVLSGDRHLSEISKSENGLVDLTSSPLHTKSFLTQEINPYRVGTSIAANNYGVITLTQTHVLAEFKSPTGKVLKSYTFPLNSK